MHFKALKKQSSDILITTQYMSLEENESESQKESSIQGFILGKMLYMNSGKSLQNYTKYIQEM
jgi:hypothetical protein